MYEQEKGHHTYIHFCVLCVGGEDYAVRERQLQYILQTQQKELMIEIEIVDDTIVEETEFFNVIIQNVSGAVIESGRMLAQVQIEDDDCK